MKIAENLLDDSIKVKNLLHQSMPVRGDEICTLKLHDTELYINWMTVLEDQGSF